jgi:hypothetical protein
MNTHEYDKEAVSFTLRFPITLRHKNVPSAYYIERKKRPTVVLGISSSSSSSNSGGGGGIEVVMVAEVHYFYDLSVIEVSCL